MKKMLLFLFAFCVLCSYNVYGQVTNLMVNGQTSSFTMTSGDTLTWSYNVPSPGDTTLVEVWIDKDNSGTINSGDILWNFFQQIDGDMQGHNGPPDMDGSANGQVYFKQSIGLAPAHYIMLFENNNIAKTIAANVTALSSPVFTISGNVSNATGGVQDAVVNLGAENGENFWTAITDASGNFTIQMNSDTTGNPWRLKIDNQTYFGSDVINPAHFDLTIDKSVKTSYSNNDFMLATASATISGKLTDDNGNALVNNDAYIASNNGNFVRDALTDTAGVFKIGLLSSELPISSLDLDAGDIQDTNYVVAQYPFQNVKSGDNLTHDLRLYRTNSTITGRITVSGNAPGFSIFVYAQNADTGFSRTMTDNNGYFRVKVSTKIYNYSIALGNSAQGYSFTSPVVHAGATNVNINLVPTAIEQTGSNLPAKYSLNQNYPNPFNPTTQISYQLKSARNVRLTVYDITGRVVAVLVNQRQSAGEHVITFNGDYLSSGIYFYRLRAGNFTSTRKMVLLK